MDPRNKHHLKTLLLCFISWYYKASLLGEGYGYILGSLYNLLIVWIVYHYELSYRPPRVTGGGAFEVLVVGAGFSGIAMAIKLKELGVKFRIIEKSEKLGGTWWENKYPGCACDIPSHLYSYSFAMNPGWTRNYSEQSEIQKYLEHVAEQFGIIGKVEFGKKLTRAEWDRGTKRWRVRLEGGEEIVVNALVSCIGQLHVPQTPEFEGQGSFTGDAFHSARWRQGYQLEGKRVAVIGTGASAVQIVPAIAEKVKHLTVFQRTPCWTARKDDFAFSDWITKLFSAYPPLMYLLRLLYYWRNEIFLWATIREGGVLSERLPRVIRRIIRRQVNDPETAEKLIPKYRVGCKRVTPSTTYLKTYNRENVALVTEPIDKFTEEGIKTKDGKTHQLDTVIYATGFDILKSFQALNAFTSIGVEKPYPDAEDESNGESHGKSNGESRGESHRTSKGESQGKSQRSLTEEWADSPSAYLGVTVPDYPNAFLMLGPGTNLATNSVIFMLECQANYIGECMRAMIEENIAVFNVKRSVFEAFQRWSRETIENKAYNSPSCTSWYKNSRGVNWTLWPTGVTTYWCMTRNLNLADYDIEK